MHRVQRLTSRLPKGPRANGPSISLPSGRHCDQRSGLLCRRAATPRARSSHREHARTILSFSTAGKAAHCGGTTSWPTIQRSVIHRNAAGDGSCGEATEILYDDPRFCDMPGNVLALCSNSVCLPENNLWNELLGAAGEGCRPCEGPIRRATWGRIKTIVRQARIAWRGGASKRAQETRSRRRTRPALRHRACPPVVLVRRGVRREPAHPTSDIPRSSASPVGCG